MNLCVNGQNRCYADKLDIGQLLLQLNLTPGQVVVELNREILSVETYATKQLRDGDTLEIIQFVGGG